MSVTCDKCGCTLRGRDKKFRRYAWAQGWTCVEVFGQLIWKCGACNGK